MKNKRILVSRIDAIGDVTLTIPMCGFLKSVYTDSVIFFLGRSYTQPVITASSSIDEFINYDELKAYSPKDQVSYVKGKRIDIIIHVFPNRQLAILAKRSAIPVRIGTSHRLYHWFNCTKLVNLGRKKSNLHEAELNLRLLRALGINTFPMLVDICKYYNLSNITKAPEHLLQLLSRDKFNLIIHPKSHGSGREWSLGHYRELINNLPTNKFRIFISGSEREKNVLKDWVSTLTKPVTDISGSMSLAEFMGFIKLSDGLIASGTGPLHLAAALGINTLGLYPSSRPIHPGRWGPLGKKARYIESGVTNIDTIKPKEVYEIIAGWQKCQQIIS